LLPAPIAAYDRLKMSFCLTPDEIAELTSRTQPAAQRRWLDLYTWRYAVDSDGRPKVLRAYAEVRLGAPKAVARRGPRLDGLAA
jgi:hypothetical protein